MLNRLWRGIVWSVLTSLLLLSACGDKNAAAGPQPEAKILNIYNWPDYIAKDMIANFEKEFGIKVNYQSFENNEGLQSQLIAGSTGYDIVVPGAVFAKAQIAAGLYQPLDKTKLTNYTHVDAALMAKLEQIDPGNAYLLPWAWSFTTVGINKAKVAQALGTTALPANVWDLVFDPAYTARLKSCGIIFLDSPTEIFPPALHYLGKNAYSNDTLDHQAAGVMLAKVRPHIRLFSSTMIDDLANGKACVALGWAGDINIAKNRALENKNGQEVEALLPATGGLIFFDNLAILKDAKHPNNAHTFINYFLRPGVSAALTNELGYPTVNKASLALVEPGIAADQAVFPDAENLQKMVSPNSFSNDARQSLSQVFTLFKKGS
jgi:putrescine transport system substrate-binding protein